MKKALKYVLLFLLSAILCVLVVLCWLYGGRVKSVSSIHKLTDYGDGYDLYSMDIHYDYNLDRLINRGITDDQSMIDAILAESLRRLAVNRGASRVGGAVLKLEGGGGDV